MKRILTACFLLFAAAQVFGQATIYDVKYLRARDSIRLGNLTIREFSSDTALGVSDFKIATQGAIKAYVDKRIGAGGATPSLQAVTNVGSTTTAQLSASNFYANLDDGANTRGLFLQKQSVTNVPLSSATGVFFVNSSGEPRYVFNGSNKKILLTGDVAGGATDTIPLSDRVTNAQNTLALKLNISDTANMLTPYARGSGTANYIPKFLGSRSIGNSIIRDDGTYVAIGQAPWSSYKFSVNGNLHASGTSYLSRLQVGNTSATTGKLNIGGDATEPSLLINSGLTTTPVAGGFERNGDTLFFTNGAVARRRLAYADEVGGGGSTDTTIIATKNYAIYLDDLNVHKAGVETITGAKTFTNQNTYSNTSQIPLISFVTAAGDTTLQIRQTRKDSGNTAIGLHAFENGGAALNTAIGYNALKSNISGRESVAVGYKALEQYTGATDPIQNGLNVAIGAFAGQALISGIDDVFIGQKAGGNAKTLNTSVLIGAHAGQSIKTGDGNVVVGRAGMDNGLSDSITANFVVAIGDAVSTQTGTKTGNVNIGHYAARMQGTATDNISIGSNSSEYSYSGDRNIHIGTVAGSLSTASENAFVGHASGSTNSTGTRNVSLGAFSLQYNAVGNDVTAVGYKALIASTGSGNTALGSNSLRNVTSAINVTAGGFESLMNLTTGGNNAGFGFGAGKALTTQINNTFSGSVAGLATTSSSNTGVGYRSLAGTATGGQNTAIGVEALSGSTSGGYNIAIGFTAAMSYATGNNSVFIGGNNGSAYSGTNGVIVLSDGAGNIRLNFDNTGRLAIGSTAPTASLHLAASTTTRASLRIPTGTAPTSPNAGDIYFNGTNFFGWDGSAWKQLDN